MWISAKVKKESNTYFKIKWKKANQNDGICWGVSLTQLWGSIIFPNSHDDGNTITCSELTRYCAWHVYGTCSLQGLIESFLSLVYVFLPWWEGWVSYHNYFLQKCGGNTQKTTHYQAHKYVMINDGCGKENLWREIN